MAYQWNWYIFLQPASAKDSYLDWLLSGMLTTLQMGCLAWVIAFCLGSLLGVMRTIPNRAVSFLAELYVEIFRNIPLIVQLFMWYYLVPKLMPQEFRTWLFALPLRVHLFIQPRLVLDSSLQRGFASKLERVLM